MSTTMLQIKSDGTIRLTRGDTAELKVDLVYDGTENKYVMNSSDKLTLTIKKSTKDVQHLVQKVVTGTDTIVIEPADTAGLSFGKYKYDVQLDTVDGKTYTPVEVSVFEILEEVT